MSKRSEKHHKRLLKWKNIVRAFDFHCFYCNLQLYNRPKRRNLNAKVTLDRVVPRSKGGTACFWNCVPACEKCNSNKSGLTVSEFLEQFPVTSIKELKDRWVSVIPYLFGEYFKIKILKSFNPNGKFWLTTTNQEFKLVMQELNGEHNVDFT